MTPRALLALACLLAVLSPALATTYYYQEGLPANTCAAQPVDFVTSNFDYTVTVNSRNLGSCPANQVAVSRLFISGTCINQRNNQASNGCGNSGGTTVPYYSGTKLVLAAPTCSYAAAYAPGDAWWPLSGLSNGQTFDAGSMCTYSRYGVFYLQNNCSSPVDVELKLNYASYYGSCSTHSYWWRWLLGVFIILAILALIGSIFMRRRRMQQLQMQQQAAAGVQMQQPSQPIMAGQTYSHQQPYAGANGAWGAQPPQQQPYGQQPPPYMPQYGSQPAQTVTGYPTYPAAPTAGYPPPVVPGDGSAGQPGPSQPPPYKL